MLDGGATVKDAGTWDGGQDSGTVAPADAGLPDDGGTDAGAWTDLCATQNGGCDAHTTCTADADGGVLCGACPSGFTGDGVTGCVDLDECATGEASCGAQECVNTEGAFTCVALPVSVLLRDAAVSPFVGIGGTTRWEQCPAGQVIVGYSFAALQTVPAKISLAGPYCSELTLTGTRASDLAVHTTLPSSTVPSDRFCPQDEVVVGLDIDTHSGIDMESAAVQCAPLTVSVDGEGVKITTGAMHELDRFPSDGPTPTEVTRCPDGSVAYGSDAAGGQILGGFSLRCATLASHKDLPAITFDTQVETPLIGTSSGTGIVDLCGEGEVVTGLMIGDSWRSYAVRCSTPVLDAAPAVPLMNPEALPTRGDVSIEYELGCGPEASLVGFQVAASSSFLYRLDAQCAPLTATSSDAGWTVSVAPPSPGPTMGSLAVTPDQTTTCPEGTAPIGVRTATTLESWGYDELSSVGLICGTPKVLSPSVP